MRRVISALLVVLIMTIGQSGDILLADSKQIKFADSELSLVFANGPSENQDVKGLFTLSLTSTGNGTISSIELEISSDGSSCCLLYTSPSPRDISGSRMPSSA